MDRPDTRRDDDELAESTAAHRASVVERLIARGLSPHALRQLFPDWQELIDDATTSAVVHTVSAE